MSSSNKMRHKGIKPSPWLMPCCFYWFSKMKRETKHWKDQHYLKTTPPEHMMRKEAFKKENCINWIVHDVCADICIWDYRCEIARQVGDVMFAVYVNLSFIKWLCRTIVTVPFCFPLAKRQKISKPRTVRRKEVQLQWPFTKHYHHYEWLMGRLWHVNRCKQGTTKKKLYIL